MAEITNLIIYFFLFLSLFFEVFLLVTYFERKRDIDVPDTPDVSYFPTVTILVPVWNEESTVAGTLDSLLALDYPKDKLKIMVINDGSTDGTAEALKRYESNPQITVAHKENGGKHSALNYGLERVDSELVGCLDADSFVDSQALKHIVHRFDDPKVMAVVPSIKTRNPRGVMALIQDVEFLWGIFLRKIFSFIDALYVTPGPFSIFRKTVFDTLGPYRHAHNTEDLELALRLQSNHYKIVNSHKAMVFTVPMPTPYKLYKQRLRWTYGFLMNAMDYKHLYFKRGHGALAFFILPMATITIFSALYFTGMTLYTFASMISKKVVELQTVGFRFNLTGLNFDWFYVDTDIVSFITLVLLGMSITIILLAKGMAKERQRPSMDIVYFLTLYSFLAPFWLARAVYNVLFSKKTTWR